MPKLVWEQDPSFAIHSIEPLGEGDFCRCYLVNGTHVVRLAKHANASIALRREQYLLPSLADYLNLSIPLPAGTGIQLDSGERFICYPLVPGTLLEPAVLLSRTAACQTALARQMAEFVRRLHSFSVETAQACGLIEKNPIHVLRKVQRRASTALAPQLDAAVWCYHQRLFEQYFATPALHAYTPALLHGDLSPGHWLADLERCALTGVIDFGDSMVGDPHWDLIYLLEDYGQEFFELFLTFYAPATAAQVRRRVQLFQQLNNIDYCLSLLSEGKQADLADALHVLILQATTLALP